MSSRRPSNELIIEAMRVSGGILAIAAQKLNVARSSMFKWVSQDPELSAARDDIRAELLDLCEIKLLELIEKGDFRSIVFYLRCFGKHRGWSERVEVTRRQDDSWKTDPGFDITKLSLEEAVQMEQLLMRAAKDTGAIRQTVPKTARDAA